MYVNRYRLICDNFNTKLTKFDHVVFDYVFTEQEFIFN